MTAPGSNGNFQVDSVDLAKYYENSHAIIIGIKRYKEESALTNAENDATAIMQVLEKNYGFNTMKHLFNENVTHDQIIELFQDMIQDKSNIGPKDRLLIYYSGHGKLRISSGREGEELKEGYIVPYDSKKEKYYLNIPMEMIIKACQTCPAKHILLILDCCYSGFATTRAIESHRIQGATEDYIRDISSRVALQVLTTGQEDQPVSDSGIRPGYSAFTGALLDILESETDPKNDGIITASEIGSALEYQVSQQTGIYQRPVYSHITGSRGGDFIFKIFKRSYLAVVADDKVVSTKLNAPIQITFTVKKCPPADTLVFSIVRYPKHGTIERGITSNTITYSPARGYAGPDAFTYNAIDNQGVQCEGCRQEVWNNLSCITR